MNGQREGRPVHRADRTHVDAEMDFDAQRSVDESAPDDVDDVAVPLDPPIEVPVDDLIDQLREAPPDDEAE